MALSDIIRKAGQKDCGRTFFYLPTIDLYILREFMIPFSILLFAFIFLFFIGDLFNDLSDFLENKAEVSYIISYYLLKIPGNIRFVLPISVLLSCMYTLANFGRNREITAMRSSGFSLVRCCFSIYIVGFLVMIVNYWFNEQIIPETTMQTELMHEKMEHPDYEQRMYSMLQFRSSDNLRDWLFQSFDKKGEQKDVVLKKYTLDQDGKRVLDWDIRARSALFIPGKCWQFKNVSKTVYHKQLFLPGIPQRLKELEIPLSEIPEDPQDIANAVKEPEELSCAVLFDLLNDNASMAPSLRGVYKTLLYYRLAFPSVCFLCVFLALPLAAKNERGGIFLSILTAVAVIVIYQVMTEVFLVLGKQGFVPPIVGGLTPTVVFTLYGWFFVVRKAG